LQGGVPVQGQNSVQKLPTSWRIVFSVVIPLMLVLIVSPPKVLINMVFQGLGIRVVNVSIEIPESELGQIERVVEIIERPILDCRRLAGGRLLLHNADVLWSGLGSVSLVSFNVRAEKIPGYLSPEPDILREAILRLDATSMRIIKTKPKMDPCFDVSADMLFEPGSKTLTTAAETSLHSVASAILTGGAPRRIVVRGHSDALPLRHSMAGKITDNQHLSELRADEVAKALGSLLDVPAIAIVSEGVGRREPKVKCPEMRSMTLYERERCHAPNRRVEIRVYYSLNTQPAASK